MTSQQPRNRPPKSRPPKSRLPRRPAAKSRPPRSRPPRRLLLRRPKTKEKNKQTPEPWLTKGGGLNQERPRIGKQTTGRQNLRRSNRHRGQHPRSPARHPASPRQQRRHRQGPHPVRPHGWRGGVPPSPRKQKLRVRHPGGRSLIPTRNLNGAPPAVPLTVPSPEKAGAPSYFYKPC